MEKHISSINCTCIYMHAHASVRRVVYIRHVSITTHQRGV